MGDQPIELYIFLQYGDVLGQYCFELIISPSISLYTKNFACICVARCRGEYWVYVLSWFVSLNALQCTVQCCVQYDCCVQVQKGLACPLTCTASIMRVKLILCRFLWVGHIHTVFRFKDAHITRSQPGCLGLIFYLHLIIELWRQNFLCLWRHQRNVQ